MPIPFTTMTGRLTADPELRYTASGTPVASFRMAENDSKYNEQTREWETASTLFLTVNAWERLAESVANCLHKGDAVMVTGKLATRQWQDKDGNNRSTIEMTARDIRQTMHLPRADGTGGYSGRAGGGGHPQQQQQASDPWGGAPAATGDGFSATTDDEPPF